MRIKIMQYSCLAPKSSELESETEKSVLYVRPGHPGTHDLNLWLASEASCVRHQTQTGINDSHTDKMIPDQEILIDSLPRILWQIHKIIGY